MLVPFFCVGSWKHQLELGGRKMGRCNELATKYWDGNGEGCIFAAIPV